MPHAQCLAEREARIGKAGSCRFGHPLRVWQKPHRSRVTPQELSAGNEQHHRHRTDDDVGSPPAKAGDEHAGNKGDDHLPATGAHLDDTGHHASPPHKPPCRGAERYDVHRAHAHAHDEAVEEVQLPGVTQARHEQQPQAKQEAGDGNHDTGAKPVVQPAHQNAENAHNEQHQRLGAGERGPRPVKLAEQRLEEDAKGGVGADAYRLDAEAGGGDDVAIEEGRSLHIHNKYSLSLQVLAPLAGAVRLAVYGTTFPTSRLQSVILALKKGLSKMLKPLTLLVPPA